MSALAHRRLHAIAAGLAGAYLSLVALLEALRQVAGWPDPTALASSPAGVAVGNLWELLTSGLVVAGEPVEQLFGTAVTALLVIQLLGAPAFWAAALAAHVGSAVIAYAGVGVLWLVARPDVDAVVDAPDYGISCVWAGAAGALAAAAWRGSRVRLVALGAIGSFLLVIPASTGMVGAEHALAFALGALSVVALGRLQGRSGASA